MITLNIYGDSPEQEVAELRELIGGGVAPANIYDDVATLKEQVDEILQTIAGLETNFVPEHAIDISNTDLNSYTGKILIGYGNHCLNKPTTQNGYLIVIPHHSAPDKYCKQIWITRPSNNVFVRNLDDGVWSDWDYAHYDTGWRSLTLAAGVSAQNASEYPCRYRRIDNVVYLEGCVKGFSEVEKVVANLPEGYRPNKSFYYQTATNAGKTDTFRIYTTGAIQRIATTNTPTTADNYHFINTSFVVN